MVVRRNRRLLEMALCVAVLSCGIGPISGCRAPRGAKAAAAKPMSRRAALKSPIRRVVCVYDQRPWLNLDRAADRDPEGVRFRVFLDPGTGRGVL